MNSVSEYQFYGRKKGRKLSKKSTYLIDKLLPELQIKEKDCSNGLSKTIFGKNKIPIFLEIGFGYGENIIELSKKRPDWGFIGIEPYLNGVASLLNKIDEFKISNIRIISNDARPFLKLFPSNSINEAAILFPDPWPKTKHISRRFVQDETISDLSRILNSGGFLKLASDDPGMQTWILKKLINHKNYHWLVKNSGDWKNKPESWPLTRYMLKAQKNDCKSFWFNFQNIK